MERSSPISPVAAQAVGRPGGTYAQARFPSGEQGYGTQVPKGGSKGGADPSMGTAIARPSDMERTGAAFRVRQDVFGGIAPPNEPFSAANLANTPVVQDASVPTPDKNYPKGTNNEVQQQVAISRDGSLPYLG